MKLQATQRLVIEDFPEQKDWIGPMFQVLNKFITDVVGILNANALFAENIAGTEKSIDFTYVSDAATFPVGFRWGLTLKPSALNIISATEDGAAVIALASWQLTDAGNVMLTRVVKVDATPAISALTVGARYKVRVRVSP